MAIENKRNRTINQHYTKIELRICERIGIPPFVTAISNGTFNQNEGIPPIQTTVALPNVEVNISESSSPQSTDEGM